MKKKGLVVAWVLLIVGAFLGGFYLNKPSIKKEEPVGTYVSGIQNKDFYDRAYDLSGEVEEIDANSAIVAHHLVVSDKIAEIFQKLGRDDVKTVVLVSPNHFSVGFSPAQVSKESWQTPYGALETDVESVEKLLEEVEILDHEEWAFEGEHGVGVITPYIKRSFPKAKIVPIVVHESLEQSEAEELGRKIADILPDAVLIASIDMSHNLPEYVQEYHDDVTKRVIEAGQGDVNLEIDSNASLQTLFAFNVAKGTRVWHETHHGSSLAMGLTNDWRENTSHILGYFTKGEPETESFASIHVVGDVMLDRGVRVKINEAGTVAYPWEEMGRFLMGSHLRVANLEGTVNEQESTYTYNPPFRFVFSPEMIEEMKKHIDAVSLANNHMWDVGASGEIETREWLESMEIPWFGGYADPSPRFDTTINGFDVSFIGYHQFSPHESGLRKAIQDAKAEDRFVIVMPHWGAEYFYNPDSNEKRLAGVMVDAGADLVIGGHPHVVQGMEVLDDVPVVYSLGNFIFDQRNPITWYGLTVGIILKDDSVILHLMPVASKDGKPAPLSDQEARQVLQIIADSSPEELREQILSGTLTFDL